MREILFRAKRIDNGEWVEGSLLVLDADSGYYFITEEYTRASTLPVRDIIFNHTHFVKSDTICQYTGLCDKNGRKIWENDIVDMNRKGCGFKRIEKVFYEEGAFSPISVHGWECVPDAEEIEVIGNIFDNPELLEDK